MEQIIFQDIYGNIKNIIDQAKTKAMTQVNQGLVLMYRQIGKTIKEYVIGDQKVNYGDKTIKTLGEKLTLEYGTGFGYRNLFRMLKLFEIFQDIEKLTTMSSKCSWSHFLEFIKIEDETIGN